MITFSDKRLENYSLPASDPLFFRLGFLKVHDIFKLKIAKFVFKSLNNDTPLTFHDWFTLTSHIHRYNTRSKFTNIDSESETRTLFIHYARTTHYGMKLIKVLGSRIWNQLPPFLRVEDMTPYSFNYQIKKHLLFPYSITTT